MDRSPHPILSARGLNKTFGGITAVSDLSFDVFEGEIVGVVGPNGAGKSTLFALLGGSLRPQAGSITFQGRRITGWSPDQAARAGLARTHQIMRPFRAMTVLENVAVGALLRESSMKVALSQATRAIQLVGLSEKIKSLAGELSTGQRKRLEMARAMATRPSLLLLDEVTAGVDQRSIPGLIELIGVLRDQGTTLVVIEHNMRVIMSIASRIIAMHMGRKIADASPSEVVTNPTVIDAYLGPAFAAAGYGP